MFIGRSLLHRKLRGEIALLRPFKLLLEAAGGRSAGAQKRKQHVKGMEEAGVNIQLGRHPGFPKMADVGKGFRIKGLAGTDKGI